MNIGTYYEPLICRYLVTYGFVWLRPLVLGRCRGSQLAARSTRKHRTNLFPAGVNHCRCGFWSLNLIYPVFLVFVRISQFQRPQTSKTVSKVGLEPQEPWMSHLIWNPGWRIYSSGFFRMVNSDIVIYIYVYMYIHTNTWSIQLGMLFFFYQAIMAVCSFRLVVFYGLELASSWWTNEQQLDWKEAWALCKSPRSGHFSKFPVKWPSDRLPKDLSKAV